MKKNTIIIVLVILAIVGIVGFLMFNQGTNACGDTNGDVTVHYYDEQGNPICASQTASVVGLTSSGGVRGVGFIDLTVKVSNDPTSIPLFCDMVAVKANGATESVFDKAMPRSTITLSPGQAGEWTSNRFAVSGFEGTPTPDSFSVDIQCQYTDATGNHPLTIKPTSIDIYIQSDGSGSFQVGINNPGGLPQMYCGDNACNNGENTTTCPVDCIIATNSQFRTSDLSYPQGSAVAIGTCGSALTQYGYSSTSCWAVTGTACPTQTGFTQLLTSKTIPPAIGVTNRPFWADTTTPTCLYSSSAGVSVAFRVSSIGGSPCGTVGNWGIVNYATSSSYKTNVASDANTINVGKEVTCP